MVANERMSTKSSPEVEVGEIDTRAPFQSVKDAVSLFGEGAFSGEKPAIKKARSQSVERVVLVKEAQLHLLQKELNKLKEQLQSAETTKAQEVVELERAKRTLDDLSHKLKTVIEAKEVAIKVTESPKNQANQLQESNPIETDGVWKHDLETTREQCTAAINELDSAKKELQKIRQDCVAITDLKSTAFKLAVEAENEAKTNTVTGGELSKEITAVQESIGQVKLATTRAQQDRSYIYAEKDVQKQSHKAKLEESAKKLLALREEIDPELSKHLESQLAKVDTEIEALSKDTDNAKASDIDSVRSVTLELDDAKDSLKKLVEEESSLQSLVESLKLELENVKKEHSELADKENETGSIAANLHVKLLKSKSELEGAIAEESKVRGASDNLIFTLNQLSSETEDARNNSENMKKKAEDFKKEAENLRIALQEAENKLKVAILEAEEAKAAESRALNQIKIVSKRTNAARASTSESGAQITISREEFELLNRKVEESEKLAEMKVGAAMAQVEAVKAGENEAIKKLEVTQKEIDDVKAKTVDLLNRAEMAEAAKKAVEGELRRWRERKGKKAVEAAAQIWAETEKPLELSPSHYRVQKQYETKRVMESRKLEKAKSKTKKVLQPSFSDIFRRKNKQVEGSYLPGERSL